MNMNTSEKTYIKVLKNLFEKGDEEDIRKYILNFNENDDEYDIFIQKLQEFVKIDELDIVEEMIYDDELVTYREFSPDDYDFNDEQELESYLLGEKEEKDEFDDIPDKNDEDELSMENLKNEVSDDVQSWGEDLLGEVGIEDLAK